MMRRQLIPLVVLLVSAAGGCDRTHDGDLARSDPQGARACEALRQWLGEDHASADAFALSKEVARYASAATTASIRSTVNGVADIPRSGGPNAGFDGVPLVDLRKLRAACVAAGIDLPPYHE